MCAAMRRSEAERKQEIMQAAAEVIISKGLDKATMEEIISKTTLSKGGVYNYYGSVIEIFKDIMFHGIEYRNKIIKEHFDQAHQIDTASITKEFMAKELVSKMIDDNPYMPLYVEFLITKKRRPELNALMTEFQEKTKERFNLFYGDGPPWGSNENIFAFLTDFINAMIVASESLGARENFTKNRQLLEQMLLLIFNQVEED